MSRFNILPQMIMFIGASSSMAQSPTLLKWEIPEYPNIARAARISGNIDATLYVDEVGKVKAVDIQMGTSDSRRLLLKSVNQALSKWEFKPGQSGFFFVELAFHLFPTATPDSYVKSEFLPPNLLIIRSKVLKPDSMIDSFPKPVNQHMGTQPNHSMHQTLPLRGIAGDFES